MNSPEQISDKKDRLAGKAAKAVKDHLAINIDRLLSGDPAVEQELIKELSGIVDSVYE